MRCNIHTQILCASTAIDIPNQLPSVREMHPSPLVAATPQSDRDGECPAAHGPAVEVEKTRIHENEGKNNSITIRKKERDKKE